MRGQSPPECSGLGLGWGVAGPGKTRDESHVISVSGHLNLTLDYSHLCCLLFSVSGIKNEHPGGGPSPEIRAPFRKADGCFRAGKKKGVGEEIVASWVAGGR